MITIFTPTYNRGKYLSRVYNSLLSQSYKDFQWLIIDDGSIDDTKNLVKTFIDEKRMDIRYVYTPNGGKHRAINLAATIAKTPWFFFLDSDDWLLPDGLEILNYHIEQIEVDKERYCALCGLCKNINGRVIGTTFRGDILDVNILDADIYKITGDKAWAVRTDLLVKYPFPEFKGENFVTESTWFNLIASIGYIARYFNTSIKKVEYLNDGLSSAYTKLLAENWQGTLRYYNDYFRLRINYKNQVFRMLQSFLSVCRVKNISVSEAIQCIDKDVYRIYKRDIDALARKRLRS